MSRFLIELPSRGEHRFLALSGAKGGSIHLTTRDRAWGMSLSTAEATLRRVKAWLPEARIEPKQAETKK